MFKLEASTNVRLSTIVHDACADMCKVGLTHSLLKRVYLLQFTFNFSKLRAHACI